jgi:FkbM family methyltransferase
LFYQWGCRGINVEANPDLIEPFYSLRPEDVNLNVGVAAKSGILPFYIVADRSGLNSFMKEAAESRGKIQSVVNLNVVTIYDVIRDRGCVFPDLLSIDIERLDYEVLASIDYDSGSVPKVICAECIVGSEDGKNIKTLLEQNGYFFYVRSGGNAIFVRNEFKDRMF